MRYTIHLRYDQLVAILKALNIAQAQLNALGLALTQAEIKLIVQGIVARIRAGKEPLLQAMADAGVPALGTPKVLPADAPVALSLEQHALEELTQVLAKIVLTFDELADMIPDPVLQEQFAASCQASAIATLPFLDSLRVAGVPGCHLQSSPPPVPMAPLTYE